MSRFKSSNVLDNEKNAIVSSIVTAITSDMPEIIQDYNLPTAYGAGHFRWNFINRNVLHNLEGRFQIAIVKRGVFPVLIIYDQSSGFSFSIMAERNLYNLAKCLPKTIHYIEALIAHNTGYEITEGQLSFDEDTMKIERNPTIIENIRNQLLCSFSGIIKNHILITFEYDLFRVTAVKALLLTPEFHIAFSENWSEFLDKPYVVGKNSIIAKMNEQDNEKPLVKLKNLPKEQHTEELISLIEIPSVEDI